MKFVLLAAAAYNILFGAWAILLPNAWFSISGIPAPRYPEIWQCVGMIVGLYGLGYAIAAFNPVRHWPIILIGLLGKILGPIGFLQAILTGSLPLSAGWLLLTNDLIWWVPFTLILWHVARVRLTKPFKYQEPLPLEQAAGQYKLSTGETLAEASAKRPLALVFLRHFGCTFTRQAIVGLTKMEEAASANGAQLVIVHMLQPGRESTFIDASNSHRKVARISDPHCELYRAFGLGKGGFWELFGPRVWWHGMIAMLGGCGVGKLAGDGFQLPGAFLFHNGEIVRSQPARDASDLPDLISLFEVGA